MAMCCFLSTIKGLRVANLNFSTSCSVWSMWRKKQGLEENPRKFSPLTLLPDYSFLDGRPVPVSLRKLRKIEFQKKLFQKVVELTHEMDVGLELYHKREEEKILKRKNIIEKKLKEKGAALQKKKK